MPFSSSHAQKIVQTKANRVEVLASPGSGKTYALVRRVQHLVASGVPAHKILVLSFSKATVCELRRRMDLLSTETPAQKTPKKSETASANADFTDVSFQTAHAFALSLASKTYPKPRLLNDKTAESIIKQELRQARTDCKSGTLWPKGSSAQKRLRMDQLIKLKTGQNIKLILRLFATAAAATATIARTLESDQFQLLRPYLKVLVTLRKRFNASKVKHCRIDYGDMLAEGVKAIADRSQAVPFLHILVDEFQDCSAAQTSLIVALAQLPGRSLMVLGDPHQAIFGFAGARYARLSSVLDDVVQIGLPKSRRLTAPVAALASAVAQLDTKYVIQTVRSGLPPVLCIHQSLARQTLEASRHIQQLIRDGAEPNQIVVLARTKALLAPVEQTLLAAGIETSRLGSTRHRKHALNVLRLVRLVERSHQNYEELDLVNALPRFLWHFNFDDKKLKAGTKELLKAREILSLEGRYWLCCRTYLRLLGGLRKNPEIRADVNRWEASCRGHLSAAAMARGILAMAPSHVVTSTIHGAKGGEWDHVLIVGATDGLLPLYLSRDKASLAEERNLLYVAITRAAKSVMLFHAPTSHARSRQHFPELSRFLNEPAVKCLLETD